MDFVLLPFAMCAAMFSHPGDANVLGIGRMTTHNNCEMFFLGRPEPATLRLGTRSFKMEPGVCDVLLTVDEEAPVLVPCGEPV